MKKSREISTRAAIYYARPDMQRVIDWRVDSLARSIQRLASKFFKNGVFIETYNQSEAIKRQADWVHDLTELWDLAAGCKPQANATTKQSLEHNIWQKVLAKTRPNLREASTDEDKAKINKMLLANRSALFGPLLFKAAEQLEGEALELAWDLEIWTASPKAEPFQVAQRLNARLARLRRQRYARRKEPKAPLYPQDLQAAAELLSAWQFGEIKPSGYAHRQSVAADFVRAAVAFWNQAERAKAIDVFRAIRGEHLAPNPKAQQMIEAARKTFARLPTTERTIRNLLAG